jgi:hypothetical protein
MDQSRRLDAAEWCRHRDGESAGGVRIDSRKKLRHRVPANLYVTLKSVNAENKIRHHARSEAQVEVWIAEAASIVA